MVPKALSSWATEPVASIHRLPVATPVTRRPEPVRNELTWFTVDLVGANFAVYAAGVRYLP